MKKLFNLYAIAPEHPQVHERAAIQEKIQLGLR